MADLINEIVSPEALAQLDELKKSIDENAKALKDLAAAGRGLDFSKAKTLSDLGEWSEKYEKTIQAMTAANQNYANNLQKAIVLKQQLNGSTKEVVATYDKLEAAELKAAKTAEIREKAAQRAASEAEKAAKREEKALRELNNEYELLKKAYKDAADKAKELGVSFGTNSKVFKDAAANAKVMYDRLLKVEMAVGQGQRAVGQYNQAAFAMQQILRETPAFAYSFATGISAISNNIPPLIDALKGAKAANAELVASGGKAIPIWKTLGKELLSFGGIATILVGVGTIVAAKWDSISAYFKKAGEELKQYTSDAAQSAAKEMSTVKVLQAIATDTKQLMATRLEAVKKLQDQYPAYLGNLSKEAILAGDTADAMERLNKALINKAIMEAYSDKVAEQAKKFADLSEELKKYEAQEKEASNKFNQLNAASTNQYAVNSRVRAAQDEANAKRKVKNIKEDIDATKKEMDRLQNEADKFGKMAAGLVAPPHEDKTKKDKVTKTTDTTLKSETDLIKAKFDNKQKELEITRDTNKAIADDTKQELQIRLDAYQKYTAAVLELAQQERNMTIDIENEKLWEIEKKKKTAKGKELSNLLEQELAVHYRINTAEKELRNQQASIARDGKKEILGIVYSSNDQWIKSEEFRNEKLKELQINLFLQDSERLRKALENKEITQKEYNKRMAELRKTEAAMILQDDIDLYKKLLQNQTLSAEVRLDLQKKLNQAEKAKSQMSQGQAPKGKSGRLTDGLATSLGITDESEQQAFYDASVNLANQAADAIISAHNRQYEAEMAMLDRKREAIQTNYDMQMNLIQATSKTEEEYANRVAKLNSQRAEQEAAIEQQKKEAAIKQARFEKAAATASIIQSTAVAIAGALKYGPAAPPIIALIAAAGAAQLASVLSAPLPAYKEGTNYHKGGAFIAGDGGEPELIVAPNKSPYWSNSVSTLYSEGAGTKVIPMSDIMQYTSTNTDDFSSAQLDALATRVAKSFDKTGYKIAQVIQASKPNINMSAVAEEMRRERNLQGK